MSAINSVFSKLRSLPKLARREHEEFAVTAWVSAKVGLEICEDMAPGFVYLALDTDQTLPR